MIEREVIYLEKAVESLAGAESEYVNRRYNNCANRCYYACFHAAVHALLAAGIQPPRSRATWSHEQVQATFAGELIHRRKVYAAELRDVLPRTYLLRQSADYQREMVSTLQAERSLRRTQRFLTAVIEQGGETR